MREEKLLNLSLLVLRVIVGGVYVSHGAQKLFGMFNGIGLEGTVKLVEGLGIANPHLAALIWAYVEFIGGIFLILGIFARWAATILVFTVVVYLWKINLVYGVFVYDKLAEYNLLVIGSCLPIILLGGGSWSVWDV